MFPWLVARIGYVPSEWLGGQNKMVWLGCYGSQQEGKSSEKISQMIGEKQNAVRTTHAHILTGYRLFCCSQTFIWMDDSCHFYTSLNDTTSEGPSLATHSKYHTHRPSTSCLAVGHICFIFLTVSLLTLCFSFYLVFPALESEQQRLLILFPWYLQSRRSIDIC